MQVIYIYIYIYVCVCVCVCVCVIITSKRVESSRTPVICVNSHCFARLCSDFYHISLEFVFFLNLLFFFMHHNHTNFHIDVEIYVYDARTH